MGNVLVTVSDKKIQHSSNNSSNDYYLADVVTANDYYPFGMAMPGRQYTQANSGYRYGFNGKENDPDMDGNNYDYGFRIYNPQIGKFLSVDPLQKKYPWFTPYQFASNMPIAASDLDGLESIIKVKCTIMYNSILSRPSEILVENSTIKSLKAAMADAIIPTLAMPDDIKSKYNFVIKETIINSLSINFVENTSNNIDGSKNTIITAVGDIAYDKLFGENKNELVEKISKSFDAFSSISGNGPNKLYPKTNNGLFAANIALKLYNGDNQDVALEGINKGVEFLTKKVIKTGIDEGLITFGVGAAEGVASTIIFTLIPLKGDSDNGPKSSFQNKIKEVKNLTISALLFKFMKNNEGDTKKANGVQTPTTDHPEDKIKSLLPNN